MVRWQETELYSQLQQNYKETGVPIGTQQRPYGTHKFLDLTLSEVFPSVFTWGMNKLGSSEDSSSSTSSVSPETAEQIKQDIDEILEKYKDEGITSIGGLEALLAQKEAEASTNSKQLEEDIKAQNNIVNEKTDRNNQIDSSIANLNKNIKGLEEEIRMLENENTTLGSENSQTSVINEKKQQLVELENQIKALEDEKKRNTGDINTALENKTTSEATLAEFRAIEKDIDNLKIYAKDLKKAEGTDAIESLTNESTADIAELIRKKSKADSSNDTEKSKKYEAELKKALEEYVKNPDNKNKTFIGLAKKLGVAA